MNKFWTDYPEIQSELERITAIIQDSNKLANSYLNDSIKYQFSSGGKMLRPAFVLIGSTFGQAPDKEKIYRIASAVEILHSATLLHDDVIDEAKMRRNQASIQSKYSKEYAIYMGDFLFSQCFSMLAEYEVSIEVLKHMARGINVVCRGEMLQNALRYQEDISTRDYLKIITGKTAALFAASLSVGAKEAGVDDKTAKKLAKIGGHVGMAFQLIDDLLDYEGTTESLGKDVQGDIARGYYSLPMIRALKTPFGKDMHLILEKSQIDKEDVMTLIHLSKQSGSVERTRRLAQKYTDKAIKETHELDEGTGKDLLLSIIPRLLKRNY